MAVISRFAGIIDAYSYAYGINPDAPVALQVISGSTSTGSYTITCQNQTIIGADSIAIRPSTTTPIAIGYGTGYEIVTPTAVTLDTLGNLLITATFANAHGAGDAVRSGTYGLQEALNYTASINGGIVAVKPQWFIGGGTNAIIAAATVPANTSVMYTAGGGLASASNAPSSVTVLAAPTAVSTAAATNGLLTTATTGGSIPTASTYRVAVTYVDSLGGETLISTDTASTSTIATGAGSTNILGLTSPAALTGAIGYRVYVSAASGAAGSEILYPVGNANITGTAVVVPTGPFSAALPAFQIGTPVTITGIITGTAKVPAQATAYTYATATTTPAAIRSYPPFTALGTIAAAATGTVGQVNLPAGFFNSLGRTVRIKGMLYATTNGTGGTITLQHILASVFGVTSITPFTAATSAVAASAIAVSMIFEVLYVTAAVGATGTLECHGFALYNVAGTAVATGTMDNVITVSSTVDLTKQLTLSVAHLNTTLGTSVSQLRQLTVEVLA